jgi:hypothetical protein
MAKPAGSAALNFILLLGLVLILALGGYVGFTYMQTPLLTDMSPNPARAAGTVTLRGDRFSTELGGNIVLFGDKAGKVVRATPGLLEVQVPEIGLLLGEQVRVPVRVLSRGRVSGALDLAIAAPRPQGEVEEIVSVVPSSPSPAARPSPAGAASPSPSWSPGEVVAEAAPHPSSVPPAPKRPHPGASAAPAPAAGPDLGSLLGEAEAAGDANRFEAAASLYDKVLQVDPQNGKAKAGKASALAAAASLKRSFAPGKTQAEGKPVSRDKLKEFDTGGILVRRPVELPAQLEFEASPSRVKAGDSYSVKVYLRNEGGKAIRIGTLIAITTVNGTRSGGPASPRVQEVPPGQRAYLYEAAGVWKDGVTTWTLEVQVASGKGDTYRNAITWQ